jgi:uncharacterized RDD family membrane protein YckC
MEQQITSAPPAMRPVSYAGFWKRFFAYIIDAMIMGIVCLIIFLPFIFIMGISFMTEPNFEDEDAQVGLVFALISTYAMAIFLAFIAQWLYFALMESKKGATLGKMALGIKVTDMNGNMISFGKATGRYFGKILSGLIMYIGYIMAGFTQQKQALHDILAGTLVVNK